MTAQATIIDGTDLGARAPALRAISPLLFGCEDPVLLDTTALVILDGSVRNCGPGTAGCRAGAYVRTQTSQSAAQGGSPARPWFERTADAQWAYLVPHPALIGPAVK